MFKVACSDDIDILMEIENKCFLSDQFSEATYLSYIFMDNSKVFLLKEKGKYIGSIVLLFEEEFLYVASIAVLPEFQRKGHGRKMMNLAEEIAKKSGLKGIYLDVKKTNKGAISFYEKLNYLKSEELENFYSDGTDGIRYVKILN